MRLYVVTHPLLPYERFFWAENEGRAKVEWRQYAEKTYPSFDWDEEEEPRVEQVWADNEDVKYRGYVIMED